MSRVMLRALAHPPSYMETIQQSLCRKRCRIKRPIDKDFSGMTHFDKIRDYVFPT